MNHGYPVTQNPDFRMGVLHELMLLFCSSQPHRPRTILYKSCGDPVFAMPTVLPRRSASMTDSARRSL